MSYLAALPVGLGVALLAYLGLSWSFSNERIVSRQLKGLSAYEASEVTLANPVLAPFSDRVWKPLGTGLLRLVDALAPASVLARKRSMLRSAGNPRGMTLERFIVLKGAVAASSTLLLCAAALAVSSPPLGWVVAVLVGLGSYWLPDLWLSSKVADRKAMIRRSLPDLLDMLTISIEAGLGFDQAVARVVASTDGPIAEEFGRALQRIQAGAERGEALNQMSEACDVDELRTFVSAIVQADLLGVSISKVLRTHASEMRLVRRQRAEERAQKAPVKLVFPLVLCILPATMIVIMGPAIVRIGRAFGLL